MQPEFSSAAWRRSADRPAEPRAASTARPTASRVVLADLSDGQLVTLALNGRERAFGVLLDRHKPKLRRVVARRTLVREDAEDIVQDTLTCAWAALQSYNAARPFEAWLVGIAVNKCRDQGRRRAVREKAAPFLFELAPEGETDAETLMLETERGEALRRLLNRMPGGLRDSLILTTVQGASHREAADQLGLTTKGVEMRVRRARQWLRSELAGVAAPDVPA